MASGVPVEYNGVVYPSISAMCKALNVKVDITTVATRLRVGWPVKQAIETPSKDKFEYKGKTYRSFEALCRAYNKVSMSVRYRLESGRTLEDALEVDLRNIVTYEGVRYPSVTALCLERGVDATLVHSRMKAGWSLKRAIETPVGITYKGVNYRSYSELCRLLNKDYDLIRRRLKAGWSLEDAIETERSSVVYKGTEYPSKASVCREFNISIGKVQHNLSRGMSFEDAVDRARFPERYTSVRRVVKEPVKKYVYKNREFARLKDLAEFIGVSESYLRRLVHDFGFEKGCSLAEDFVLSTKKYIYKGKNYNTIAEVSVEIGVSSSYLAALARRSDSFEDACRKAEDYVKGSVLEHDGHTFESYSDASRFYGVGDAYIAAKVRSGCTFSEACEAAKVSASTVKLLRLGSNTQRVSLKASLNGDIAKCNEWLIRVFGKSPTTFNGVEYDSVESACTALGNVSLGQVRGRMLHSLLSFQDAVYDLYYVVDGVIYKNIKELAVGLRVERSLISQVMEECSTKDEFIRMIVDVSGTASSFGNTVRITRASDAAMVMDCRNGMYLAFCSVCNRPLYLSEQDAISFRHSDEFCKEHVQEVLYRNCVPVANIRARLNKTGNFEDVLDYYSKEYIKGQLRTISQSVDVSDAVLMCDRKYVLVMCKVCNKRVLLRPYEAINFRHSDKCKEFEWLV